MEDYGFLSILPPIIAITLAIITKEVFVSLVIGIFTGALIISNYSFFTAFTKSVELVINTVADAEWNIRVLLFTLLLGAIVGLLAKSGSTIAFGEWATKRIKTRGTSLLASWILGVLIFMDDYFNCLTVGTVMRPITDRFKVSRAKLAFIIDSTAAPVCILVPISTWVAYVMSLTAPEFERFSIEMNPFQAFVAMIPFNLYPWLIVLMVLVTSFTSLEFGPMARAELRALKTGELLEDTSTPPPGDDFSGMEVSKKGKPTDLIVPILVLIFLTLAGMAYTGGYFEGGKGLIRAIMDCDSATALVYGAVLTIIITVIMYRIEGVLNVSESMAAILQGFKSMMIAVAILSLAWSIGSITRELGAGDYVASIVSKGFPDALIPFLIFVTSAFMAFAMGTSWGTYAIMIPIAVPLAMAVDKYLLVSIAAVLAGGTFGDHCSPISDTTIMSSTGASCHHIEHVNTQLPYAFTAAAVAAVGFLAAGFIENAFIVWAGTIVLFFIVVKFLHMFWSQDIPPNAKKASDVKK